jgi:hypothetical protein
MNKKDEMDLKDFELEFFLQSDFLHSDMKNWTYADKIIKLPKKTVWTDDLSGSYIDQDGVSDPSPTKTLHITDVGEIQHVNYQRAIEYRREHKQTRDPNIRFGNLGTGWFAFARIDISLSMNDCFYNVDITTFGKDKDEAAENMMLALDELSRKAGQLSETACK